VDCCKLTGDFSGTLIIDTDGDGVPDEDDACPGYNDTLDEDEDGVPDGCDYCNEWIDSDCDGILDDDDDCPLEWGLPWTNGCPDEDGDGILDSDDECPLEWGPPLTNGCPDSDGDGVPDDIDACELEWGPPWNNGCPDVPPGEPVNMTGGWVITLLNSNDFTTCQWTATQTGTALSVVVECEDESGASTGEGVFTGGISPTTGDFSVDSAGDGVPYPYVCTIYASGFGKTGGDFVTGEWTCQEPVDPDDPDALCPCLDPDPVACSMQPPCLFGGAFHGTRDSDGDGFRDVPDVCPFHADPGQEDTDGDLNGDACDICPGGDDNIDTDGDGFPDPGEEFPPLPNGCDVCLDGDDNDDYDGDEVPDCCDVGAFDMTGSWVMSVFDGIPQEVSTCEWEVSQGGTLGCSIPLSVDSSCDTSGIGTFLGAIDANTGVFSTVGQSNGCEFQIVDGSTDGNSIVGAWTCANTNPPDISSSIFSGTPVRDFVISASLPNGGDCENTRFDGIWHDVASTCTVTNLNLTIHAAESLKIAEDATLVIPSNGSMTFNGGSTDGRELRVFGALTNDGSMTFNGGEGSQSARLRVLEFGSLTNNGSMTFNGGLVIRVRDCEWSAVSQTPVG